ncbi:hypothetical protein V9K67_21125 [Paraflavisolibacter sp. H34]|uniref:condensin complex protein MksE n=1 Tax=Huijunlia imazamoxiresistens TaxID=3127457 RepID=UPI00301AB286
MKLHKEYTTAIFQLLSRGTFLSANATKDGAGRLYRYISEGDHYDRLKEYFELINLSLESGDGYFYFSSLTEKETLREDKLQRFERYIDILDLLASLETPPSVGTRYTVSDLLQECLVNPRLQEKLDAIRVGSNKQNVIDKLREVLDFLEVDSFLELEDEKTETYKVLDSFHYLLQIVKQIEIYGEQELPAAE